MTLFRECRYCSCTQDEARVSEEHGACWWWDDSDTCSHCHMALQTLSEAIECGRPGEPIAIDLGVAQQVGKILGLTS